MTATRLVRQLRFARSEFMRCLEGVTEEEALVRSGPMNCISWVVGHMANQEQYLWMFVPQGATLYPELYKLVGTGKPASRPAYVEMLAVWRDVTAAVDPFLDGLTTEKLETFFSYRGNPMAENIGTLLQRNIFHYWFHTGEAHAMRQMLGHKNLPDFVGDMELVAYRN